MLELVIFGITGLCIVSAFIGAAGETEEIVPKLKGTPQPIILKNNKVTLAQILIDYHAIKKGAKKRMLKNKSMIDRTLEYEGITKLRILAGDIEDIEDLYLKYEIIIDEMHNALYESGKELGIEIDKFEVKFGDKEDFEFFEKENSL